MGFKVHIWQSKSFVLGFGNTINKDSNALLRQNTEMFDYQQSSELQSNPQKIPASEFY